MANQYNTNLFSIVPIGGHVRNAVLTTAVAITIPVNATGVIIQAEDQAVKYTIGSVAPTTDVGFLLAVADQPVRLDLFPGAVFNVIETVVGGAVNYQFFRSV